MRRVPAFIASAALAVTLLGAPPTSATPVPAGISMTVTAATPRPGQFCKRVDRGVVRPSPYGRLKCKADPKNGSWSRWYHV